jgi:excisionase family DNA binding protein
MHRSDRNRTSKPLLLGINTVCAQTELGPTKVRQLIRDGQLESVRIGKAVRVTAESLDAFVLRLRQAGAEDRPPERVHAIVNPARGAAAVDEGEAGSTASSVSALTTPKHRPLS